MKRKEDDTLVWVVVATALAVLAVTFWVGGRRLYARWQAGRAKVETAAPQPAPGEDGVDRPPNSIPPLAMVGIAPSSHPAKPRPKPPAALPMPPITPDRK